MTKLDPTATAPTDPAIPHASPSPSSPTQTSPEKPTTPAQGIDEGRFFDALDAHMERSFAAFRKEMINISVLEHEKTRKHVAQLTSMTTKLWSEVFGDEKPPPGQNGELSFALTEPDTRPGRTKESRAAMFHGQLIAAIEDLSSKIETLTKLQKEQMGLHDTNDRPNE